MRTLTDQIHLRNILTCIEDIEDYCADLSVDELLDDEIRIPVYRNLTMLGIEADNILSKVAVIQTFKSFKRADFIDGLGKDTYAISNFIMNDLSLLKMSIIKMAEGTKKKRSTKFRPLAVA